MYVCGLERLCASHRTILDTLKGRETTQIKSKDRSAAKTLLRWGVVGAAVTAAGQVVWQQAIEVTPPQLRLVQRLIGRRDRNAGLAVTDRQRDSLDALVACGAMVEEWHPDGWKVHIRISDHGLVLICRNAVHSFRRKKFR